MRENVRNENVSAATDNNNTNTSNAQQDGPAELNSASQGMIYLDIIQPFAL